MSTEQVTFLCFKCHCTFATEEMFSMHACVEVKQEIVDPRAPLDQQGDSEPKKSTPLCNTPIVDLECLATLILNDPTTIRGFPEQTLCLVVA